MKIHIQSELQKYSDYSVQRDKITVKIKETINQHNSKLKKGLNPVNKFIPKST